MRAIPLLFLTTLLSMQTSAQAPVEIEINSGVKQGAFRPLFAYFGYDEPNYTYQANGKALLTQLSALSPVPVQIRAHHLLVTGDGTPQMKWGSTNVYTLGADGKPVYDWKIIDRIFDTYMAVGVQPFVEIGFMPEALSSKPQPYQRDWPHTPEGRGWAQPPTDYDAWAELVRRWVLHEVERYGKSEVEKWSWELWNEPDIFYWRGTPEEYNKLYDYTVRAVKSALPTARVGGPATTDPANAKAGEYLRQFLAHCAAEKVPLDFITYHAKGAPRVFEGHMRMGLGRNLENARRGLEIIAGFPQYTKLPVIISEFDPEGCAACSPKDHPELAYRNGAQFASYTAAAIGNLQRLGDRFHSDVNMLTWAFEFEGKEYFEGLRTLATNGVDKPVLNTFRMAGLLHGERISATSTNAIALDAILTGGVRGDTPDIDVIATSSNHQIMAMVWNYHDDELPASSTPVHVTIIGVPAERQRVIVEHFRIDDEHSNAFTAWQRMGSPQHPTQDEFARLQAAGQLQLLGSPQWMQGKGGKLEMSFSMPRQSVSLLRITW